MLTEYSTQELIDEILSRNEPFIKKIITANSLIIEIKKEPKKKIKVIIDRKNNNKLKEEGVILLTPSEEKVYNAILSYITKYGHSPSIRDLCIITGYKSTSTIHSKIASLKRKNLLKSTEKLNRTLLLNL